MATYKKLYEEPTDIIAYGIKTKGGGVDGRDHTDKPTIRKYVSSIGMFENEMINKSPSWLNSEPVKTIIEIDKVMAELKNRLTPEERFALVHTLVKVDLEDVINWVKY